MRLNGDAAERIIAIAIADAERGYGRDAVSMLSEALRCTALSLDKGAVQSVLYSSLSTWPSSSGQLETIFKNYRAAHKDWFNEGK
jgi:hypothetical protein